MKRILGFSIIETLVVMGIIGILIALLLPAVQSAREASRRATCGANLRQIGSALSSYHDIASVFPSGGWPTTDRRWGTLGDLCEYAHVDRSIWVALAPQLEGSSMFDLWNSSVSIFAPENTSVQTARIGQLACPTDSEGGSVAPGTPQSLVPINPPVGNTGWPHTRTSYGGVLGTVHIYPPQQNKPNCELDPHVRAQNNGVFHALGAVRAAHVLDGLAQTMFVSERSVAALRRGSENWYQHHAWWETGRIEETLLTAMYSPNFPQLHREVQRRMVAAGIHSDHPGGVHVLFGDGSVRFISETIDSWVLDPATGGPIGAESHGLPDWWENLPAASVWQAMATRAGSELISRD